MWALERAQLSVEGFNDKLGVLLCTLVKTLKSASHTVTPQRFADLKDRVRSSYLGLKTREPGAARRLTAWTAVAGLHAWAGRQLLRSYRGWAKESPVNHVSHDVMAVVRERHWTYDEKHAALLGARRRLLCTAAAREDMEADRRAAAARLHARNVSGNAGAGLGLKELQAFAAALLARGHVEVLVVGNYTEATARALADDVATTLAVAELTPCERGRMRSLKLPRGGVAAYTSERALAWRGSHGISCHRDRRRRDGDVPVQAPPICTSSPPLTRKTSTRPWRSTLRCPAPRGW